MSKRENSTGSNNQCSRACNISGCRGKKEMIGGKWMKWSKPWLDEWTSALKTDRLLYGNNELEVPGISLQLCWIKTTQKTWKGAVVCWCFGGGKSCERSAENWRNGYHAKQMSRGKKSHELAVSSFATKGHCHLHCTHPFVYTSLHLFTENTVV